MYLKKSSSLKNIHFFISTVFLLVFFYFIVKSILCVCALEASHFHITLLKVEYWTLTRFQTISDIANHAQCHEGDFKYTHKKQAVDEDHELADATSMPSMFVATKADIFKETLGE